MRITTIGRLWIVVSLLVAVSPMANATLIGDTANYSNSANPALDQTFVISNDVEVFECFAMSGGVCTLFYSLDVGADFVRIDQVNNSGVDFLLGDTINRITGLDFSGGFSIAGVDVLTNTFPTIISPTFSPDSITFPSQGFLWKDGSAHQLVLGIRSAAVPEPRSLALLLVTVLGLFVRKFSLS